MKRLLTLGALLSALAGAVVVVFIFTSGPAQADQFATLRVLEGTVEVQRVGEAAARPATPGMSLSKGDVVRTGEDGRAEVAYFDGSLTRLEPETKLVIQDLAILDNDANSKVIEVEQPEGRTYNRITKLADADSRVEVETPTAIASVRGTSFAVEVIVLPDGRVQVVVWCVTGTCVVTPTGGEPQVLQAGEGTIVDEDGSVERFSFDHSEVPGWVVVNACDLQDVEDPCLEVLAGGAIGGDPEPTEADPPIVTVTGAGPSDPGPQGNDDPGPPGGDTTPPVTTITGGPSDLSNADQATFTFTSTEPGSTFECRLDGGSYQPCASPRVIPGLADGPHTFRVRATDPADNTGDPDVRVWRVDTMPPMAEITSGPDDPTSSSSAAFAFTSDEAEATFECSRGDEEFAGCETGHTYEDLDDGDHVFRLRATDPAGNTGLMTVHEWTVDTLDPTSDITHPALGGAFNEASWDAECGTPGDGDICGTAAGTGSDVTAVELSIRRDGGGDSGGEISSLDDEGEHWDGEGWGESEVWLEAEGAEAWTLAFPFGSFEDEQGLYTVLARATDAAGNVESTAVSTFEIDLTDPTVTVERADGQALLTNQAPIAFAVTFSEPVAGFASDDVSVTGTAGGTVIAVLGTGPGYTVGISNLQSDGTVIVDVPEGGVTDAAGNPNDASTGDDNEVTYDGTAPVTTITDGPEESTSETAATFEFEADDEDATFECRLNGGGWGACESPKPYEDLDPGNHTFEVRATDLAGNIEDPPAQRQWDIEAPPNQPPTAGHPSNCRLGSLSSVSITLSANDPGGDDSLLVYAIVSGPSHGLLSETAPNLVYTKGLTFPGEDSFTWTATDPGGASTTFTTRIRSQGNNGCGGPE